MLQPVQRLYYKRCFPEIGIKTVLYKYQLLAGIFFYDRFSFAAKRKVLYTKCYIDSCTYNASNYEYGTPFIKL
jgi:hypothetical protein